MKRLLARWLGAALDVRVTVLEQRLGRQTARADRLQLEVDSLRAICGQVRAALDAAMRDRAALVTENDRLAALLEEHQEVPR